MRTLNHKVDVCVVGSGMAGICAALAACNKHMHRRANLADTQNISGIRLTIDNTWGNTDTGVYTSHII